MKELDENGHEAAESARIEDAHPRGRSRRHVLMTDVAWFAGSLIRPSHGSSTTPGVSSPKPAGESTRQSGSSTTDRTRWLGRWPRANHGRSALSASTPGSTGQPPRFMPSERAAHGAGYSVSIFSLDSLEREAILDAVKMAPTPSGRWCDHYRSGPSGGGECLERPTARPPGDRGGRIDRRSRFRWSPSISTPVHRGQPAICSIWATPRSGTSPGRSTGTRQEDESTAGDRRWPRPERPCTHHCRATGARAPGTSRHNASSPEERM